MIINRLDPSHDRSSASTLFWRALRLRRFGETLRSTRVHWIGGTEPIF